MRNQIFNHETTSEGIYQEMTRDAFGVMQKNKSMDSENFSKTKLSEQVENFSRSKYEIFLHKLINRITAQLQVIIPGAFRITPQTEQCLSYANLHSWFPGRSYFTLFEMKKSKSIWLLHFSRPLGEGFAYLNRKTNSRSEINIYNNLREADSIIYFEIGEMLRNIFFSLIDLWVNIEKLEVDHCRHILQLGFLADAKQSYKYIVLPFSVDNKECAGDFHLIFPQRYLSSIL